MIRLIENLDKTTARRLSALLHKTPVSVFVLFELADVFAVNAAWVQLDGEKISALIVEKENTKLYITAAKNADFCELSEFVKRLPALVVHTESETAEKISVAVYSKLTLMMAGELKPSREQAVKINDNLRAVFDLLVREKNQLAGELSVRRLKKYNDAAYKQWLSRTAPGIFNGTAEVRAVKKGENTILSAAIADISDDGVFLRDVKTDPDFRKMGYASDCVLSLANEYAKKGKKVYLSCDSVKNERFYKGLGFETVGYISRGIYEE